MTTNLRFIFPSASLPSTHKRLFCLRLYTQYKLVWRLYSISSHTLGPGLVEQPPENPGSGQRGREKGCCCPVLTGSSCFLKEVAHVASTCTSLVKPSAMAIPKGIKSYWLSGGKRESIFLIAFSTRTFQLKGHLKNLEKIKKMWFIYHWDRRGVIQLIA